MLFSSRCKFSTKWGCRSKSPSLPSTLRERRYVLSFGMGASTGVSAQQQAGRCACSALALPPHIRETAQASTWTGSQDTLLCSLQRWPSQLKDLGKVVTPAWHPHTLMGRGQEHHPWVDIASAASICLGCTFSRLLLGLVREGLAGPLLPDLPLSPTSNLNKHRRKHSCSVFFQRRPFKYFSAPQLRFPLGKEVTVFCERFISTNDLLISRNMPRTYPRTSVFSPIAPQKTVSSKNQPHQHRYYLLFRESCCKRLIAVLLFTQNCHAGGKELFFPISRDPRSSSGTLFTTYLRKVLLGKI